MHQNMTWLISVFNAKALYFISTHTYHVCAVLTVVRVVQCGFKTDYGCIKNYLK